MLYPLTKLVKPRKYNYLIGQKDYFLSYNILQ